MLARHSRAAQASKQAGGQAFTIECIESHRTKNSFLNVLYTRLHDRGSPALFFYHRRNLCTQSPCVIKLLALWWFLFLPLMFTFVVFSYPSHSFRLGLYSPSLCTSLFRRVCVYMHRSVVHRLIYITVSKVTKDIYYQFHDLPSNFVICL